MVLSLVSTVGTARYVTRASTIAALPRRIHLRRAAGASGACAGVGLAAGASALATGWSLAGAGCVADSSVVAVNSGGDFGSSGAPMVVFSPEVSCRRALGLSYLNRCM